MGYAHPFCFQAAKPRADLPRDEVSSKESPPSEATLCRWSNHTRMDEVEDPHEDHTTQGGNDHRPGPIRWLDAKNARQRSADEAADQAKQQVTQQAIACAANQHPASQPAMIPLMIQTKTDIS